MLNESECSATNPKYAKTKKEKNFRSSLQYPLRGSTALLQSAVVCSILTFPLNPPLVKGDFARVLAY